MTVSYLIAHIVRGEPAFDIAIPLQIGDEEGWIIPTSGHRAYPYWSLELENCDDRCLYDLSGRHGGNGDVFNPPPPPPNWPDHYSTSPAPRGQGLLTNLAELLGLAAKPGKIRRR